jgi:2-polyprenyl-3-methyl-5-hydroxy-6-metoxy-1,4-benzoquinol methylase
MIPAIQSTALVTAGAVGLFEILTQGPLTAAALAERLRCDPRGTQRLAELLATMGYLEREGDRYALGGVARATYIADGELPLTHWLRFCETQLKALGHLTEAVRKGTRVDLFDLMPGPEERLIHQRAMAQTARPAAQWVADEVPVPHGARRLLDVGGGHGIYSAAICRRHPPLAAEVLELPTALTSATRVAREYGCHRHVTHRPGDIRTTALDGRYAVVFLGNLIHHYPTEILAQVLDKIAAHTAPGGTIAIWDLAVGDTAADPVAAAFALFFHLTSGAGCHSAAALGDALTAAGFLDVAVKHPPQGTTHMLVTARKG